MPSSTIRLAMTNNESGSSEKLCSAFAIALASTFATGSLAACGANLRTRQRLLRGQIVDEFTTRLAFIGETRT